MLPLGWWGGRRLVLATAGKSVFDNVSSVFRATWIEVFRGWGEPWRRCGGGELVKRGWGDRIETNRRGLVGNKPLSTYSNCTWQLLRSWTELVGCFPPTTLTRAARHFVNTRSWGLEQEFRDCQARDRNRQQRELREVLIESWTPPHLVVSEKFFMGMFLHRNTSLPRLGNLQPLLFLGVEKKVLSQKIFEVNVQNVQKNQERLSFGF